MLGPLAHSPRVNKLPYFILIYRYVRSLAESDELKYQWLPVSFVILPKQLKSKSEAKKKFNLNYTDERDEFLAFSNSLEEKLWIAKSSSGSKGK